MPPHADADTSREAARAIEPEANRIRDEVAALIREAGGLTIDELAVRRGTTPNAMSPRVRELVILGRIEDSGGRRRTRTGRRAIVWRVVMEQGELPLRRPHRRAVEVIHL
jgi:hypothetical protein